MDKEPKRSTTSEWVGLLVLAASVPLLFVGLNYLLLRLAEVLR